MMPCVYHAREVSMLSLSTIIDELFSCLGPLRACEDPIQDRCVGPVQEYLIDPIDDHCVDPILRSLEVNPLGCLPGFGLQPSLPQYDPIAQHATRAPQVRRTQPDHQHNYT